MKKNQRARTLQLISSFKQGNEASFNELISLHHDKIFGSCWSLAKNTDDAEDLYQEVLLKIFKNLKLFRGESAFTTWVHRIVRNEFLMRIRRKHPLDIAAPMLDDNDPSEYNLAQRDDAQFSTPERLDLVRAIAKLTPKQRAAFISHDVYGFQHNESPVVSVGTSKSNLHHARVRLQRLLAPKLSLRPYI